MIASEKLVLCFVFLAACGDVTSGGGASDAGSDGGGRVPLADASRPGADASILRDGETHLDVKVLAEAGGSPVDAGIYRGDGSYFSDGGAYRDADSAVPHDGAAFESDAARDSETADGATEAATTGDADSACSALAACCGSVPLASQPLCNSVVSSGSSSNCSVELAQLESGGDCTGVTVLTSGVQVTPNRLVSDGTTLFWTTGGVPGLAAMSVEGGAVAVLINEPISSLTLLGDDSTFLAVDSVNVYVFQNYSILRIPKDGSAATLVNESGAQVIAATQLGQNAYWMETVPGTNIGSADQEVFLKTATLQSGGAVTLVSTFDLPGLPGNGDVAVTGATVVVSEPLYQFAMGAGSGAGSKVSGGGQCQRLTSDTDAVYCNNAASESGSNLRIASDGSTTTLGPALNSSYVVFDDSNAYWADEVAVGTIVKAPKAGGGAVTVLASATSPTAIAVDSTYVYWSDSGGTIKRVAK